MQDETRHSRAPELKRIHRTSTRTTSIAATTLPGLLFLAQQSGLTSALDPKGPRSELIARFFWALLALAAVIFVIFVALFLIGSAKHNPGDQRLHFANGTGVVSVFGIAIPGVILLVIFGATLWALNELATPASAAEESIEIVGHQWWWEIHYPDHDFTTANEIHIPLGKDVHVKLTSADVIHSFWIPSLSDKLDMIPGKTNEIMLKADTPGIYRGQCAEFCGAQHANMILRVFADNDDTYDAWIANQQADAGIPDSDLLERGQQVYFNNACMYCHTVAGTSSSGKIGPDLTHVASRDYIAAGMLENTQGNLAGWILNNQSLKPNNQMPNFVMSPEDLQALIAWLESLK
ncbi:MAG TPA: cytochrome c oxidase subunit II [Thermomicrobiales bacterium]|nr:cytochrome c oxidase subunit II [Thermomicrobiales bacterium]